MVEVLPSCFGEYRAPPVVEESSKTVQNLVTCLYETKLWGACRLVSITWCNSCLTRQGLSVHVTDRGNCPEFFYTCKVDMKSWFFWKKHEGCKTLNAKGHKVEVFWDLREAKYACGPEPKEKFYVALVSQGEIVLLLGDIQEEAYRRTCARPPFIEPVMLCRREHVFGKVVYTTTAQLGDSGSCHEIVIECHSGGPKEARLYIRVDKQVVFQVKNLMWKFRGNQTIHVDGLPVEVFWDVHNWLFNPALGYAVFMFQASSLSSDRDHGNGLVHCPPSNSVGFENKLFRTSSTPPSVMQWVRSTSLDETESRSPSGFSLLLYAWKSH